jgi:2Fe-2S ferredoxin
MFTLKSKTKSITIEPVIDKTILEVAKEYDLQWLYNCSRGTCCRCRCLITEGQQLLSELNEKEYQRLMDDEIEEGYRLACQAKIVQAGTLIAENKTYF